MFEFVIDSNENRYGLKEELQEEGSVGLPGKKTLETLTAADLLIDALDIAEAKLKRMDQHKSLPFSDVLKLMSYLKDWISNPSKEYKDAVGFNLAAMDHLKELMSMKSDAPFRDAKVKLMEIRLQQSNV